MQRESSKFSQRRCAFLSNKGKEGWEEERRVYPWASLQGITLWVPERERDRRVEEHPVTYQSPLFWFYLFHVFFSVTCLHKLFPLQPSLLFNLCIAQCERTSLLWKLERGDDEASKLQISLFVFRLSKLLLSLFIYCTITVQFTLLIVQWNVCLLR